MDDQFKNFGEIFNNVFGQHLVKNNTTFIIKGIKKPKVINGCVYVAQITKKRFVFRAKFFT